jgi:hypothetical protein
MQLEKFLILEIVIFCKKKLILYNISDISAKYFSVLLEMRRF